MKTISLLFLAVLLAITACKISLTKSSGNGTLNIIAVSGYWFGTFSTGNK